MAATATSAAKLEANRRNARKSTGPSNTRVVRLNAATHGLYARTLTDLDDREEYGLSLARLNAEHNPVGELECFLVESIAMNMMRMRRAWRMEADYITDQLHPAKTAHSPEDLIEMTCEIIDPGQPAPLKKHMVEPLVTTFQRQQTSIANEISRSTNQLERLQRMRQGERLPAPATGDLTLHSQENR
jgi:hypothetical protein